MTYLSCIIYLILLISGAIANINLLSSEYTKVAIWNANSGFELREVCRNEKIDILIVEGLQVQSFNKGKSQCLKMQSMATHSSSNFKQFPHIYRFTKDKEKGAVYADFLEVSELGRALESCKRRKVKILIQLKIGKDVKFTRRQSILMAALLWNSFFHEGDYVERPFGNDIVFDGIHFVYEKGGLNISSTLIKRINEMASNEGKEIIQSSESGAIKVIATESSFIVTTAESITAKTVPTKTRFAIFVDGDKEFDLKRFEDYEMFKGTVKKLHKKRGRISGLKIKASQTPESSIYVILTLVISSLLVLILLTFYYLRKRKFTKKITNENSTTEIE